MVCVLILVTPPPAHSDANLSDSLVERGTPHRAVGSPNLPITPTLLTLRPATQHRVQAETAETLEDDEATTEGEPPANEDVSVDDVPLACAAGLADTGDVESRSTGSPRSQGPHGDLDAEAGTGRSEKLQEGPGVPPRAGELPPSEFPLSADEISRFEEDGFVLLRGAFDPEVAAACRYTPVHAVVANANPLIRCWECRWGWFSASLPLFVLLQRARLTTVLGLTRKPA